MWNRSERSSPPRSLQLLGSVVSMVSLVSAATGCAPDDGHHRPRHGKGVFEAPHAWTQDVSGMTKSPDSDKIVHWLDHNGGWGTGPLRIDFNLTVLSADYGTPMREFEPTGSFFEPDCDRVPFPVPEGGALEGEDGYACWHGGDCHLLVVHEAEQKLYEMWRADIEGSYFYGGCAAVWDLKERYPDSLRGDGCTSADAGGFPISAMLFSAEEVASGSIDHAVRFVLPNWEIRDNFYVRPSTHTTHSASGGHFAPPYGARLRLRDDFPMETLPSEGARVIARAIQRYGMILADGGTITLTAESDRFSEVKWADVGVDQDSLNAIQVTDMEVADMGPPIEWTGGCARNEMVR